MTDNTGNMINSVYEVDEKRWAATSVKHLAYLLKNSGLMRVDALQKTDKVGYLPVVFAVRNGAKLELVQFMYEHNIAKSREWTDSYGGNLLFHAVHKNRHSLVPYLLFMGGENGATVRNKKGQTALDMAVFFANDECAAKLKIVKRTMDAGKAQRASYTALNKKKGGGKKKRRK